ncbi:hypothetical protein IVB03_14070 [Bradyrhizobium sp. 168]|nr:hypothetical protein [Bradyrhizobium sp. 168]
MDNQNKLVPDALSGIVYKDDTRSRLCFYVGTTTPTRRG